MAAQATSPGAGLRQRCRPRRCGEAGPYLLGSLEAEADVLVVAGELLLAALAQQHPLLVLEDRGLLLVGPLRLRGDRGASRRALGAENPPGPSLGPHPRPGARLLAGSGGSPRHPGTPCPPAGLLPPPQPPPRPIRPAPCRMAAPSPREAGPRPGAGPVAARPHLRVRHLEPRGGKGPGAPRGAAYPAGRGERRKWRHGVGAGQRGSGPAVVVVGG